MYSALFAVDLDLHTVFSSKWCLQDNVDRSFADDVQYSLRQETRERGETILV